MEYRIAWILTAQRYEQLLERGWRRFGRTLFRPRCSACAECRSLRVDLQNFAPSKSQRRNLRRNQHLTVRVARPEMTAAHLDLYNRYHADMHQRRDWPYTEITAAAYAESFLDGRFSFAREFRYFHGERLVAVGMVDMTDHVMSSVYFFHEPELRSSGLGTLSVLTEISEGHRLGLRWLYLGYFIPDCQSMNYKNRFHPHQLLQSSVSDQESPEWHAP